MTDLTNSTIQRQNILNNKYALQRIQEYVGLEGMLFEGEYKFTKAMIAEFFQIDISTIERYLSTHEAELKHNGYILSRGKQLKEFKLQFGHLMNEVTKTTLSSRLENQRVSKNLLTLFSLCAVHGNRLVGGSPLWGFIVANH